MQATTLLGPDSGALMTGYLFKKGDFRQKWRPRWFILKSNPRRLEWYNSPTETVRGGIPIDERTKVTLLSGGTRQSYSLTPTKTSGKEVVQRAQFSVRTTQKILVLAHDDPSQVEEWITAIRTLSTAVAADVENDHRLPGGRRGSDSRSMFHNKTDVIVPLSQVAAGGAGALDDDKMSSSEENGSKKKKNSKLIGRVERSRTNPVIFGAPGRRASASAPGSRMQSPDPHLIQPFPGMNSGPVDIRKPMQPEVKYEDEEYESVDEEKKLQDNNDEEPPDVFYDRKLWEKYDVIPFDYMRKVKNEIIDQGMVLTSGAQWRALEVQNSLRVMVATENPNRYRLSCTFRKMNAETLFQAVRIGMVSEMRSKWDPSFESAEVVDKYGMHTDLVSLKVKLDVFGPYVKDVPLLPSSLNREMFVMRHWFALDEKDGDVKSNNEGPRTLAIVYRSINPPKKGKTTLGQVYAGGYLIYAKENSVTLVHIIEADMINLKDVTSGWFKALSYYMPFYQGIVKSRLNYLLTSELCAFRDFVDEHSLEDLEAMFSDPDTVHLGELLAKGPLSPRREERMMDFSFSEKKDDPSSQSTLGEELEDNQRYPVGVRDFERSDEGGMIYTDEQEVSNQRWIAQDLIKSMGSNIMQGKSLISISMPVKIFESRSFLQRMPDMWTFGPVYLKKAAECTDPIERLKYVMVFIISGLHRGLAQKKPFNPILGETFQCYFSDGTQISLEQTAHHPPISAFDMRAPDESYVYTGQHEYKATLGMNYATGVQDGNNEVRFSDGGIVQFNMPTIMIKGVLWGARHIYWCKSMTFTDPRNSLYCELQFGPVKKSAWFGGGGSANSSLDAVSGVICQGRDRIQKCNVEGSWLEGLSFGGKQYWRFNESKAYRVLSRRLEDSLPSDARNRMDLTELAAGNLDSANSWKHKLEELQRKDRKLRKDLGPNKGGH
eukprot:TRINITY_DN4065_c0_g1_i1.p1 TRINITY_DN4065_c0_g1~~TRINITY_DN4065_c0_g1_i1.p1  ORF type:complete len:943 (-),score=238.86 TRINITY_DN4065_c0_g1_i1:62-2890(-)